VLSTERGDDHGVAVNAGLLWTPILDRLHIGVSFASGPKFRFATNTVTGPANLGGGGINVVTVPDNPFKVPDRYSAGLAFQPNPQGDNKWTLALETDRVQYSQLMDDYRQVSLPPSDPQAPYVTRGHFIDDANEVRFGAQYERSVSYTGKFWIPSKVVARGGVFFDPQHQIYYQADDPQHGYPTPQDVILYPKAKDDWHRSVGLGLVFRHLQFDFAADFADKSRTWVVSTVIYACSDNPASAIYKKWGGC